MAKWNDERTMTTERGKAGSPVWSPTVDERIAFRNSDRSETQFGRVVDDRDPDCPLVRFDGEARPRNVHATWLFPVNDSGIVDWDVRKSEKRHLVESAKASGRWVHVITYHEGPRIPVEAHLLFRHPEEAALCALVLKTDV